MRDILILREKYGKTNIFHNVIGFHNSYYIILLYNINNKQNFPRLSFFKISWVKAGIHKTSEVWENFTPIPKKKYCKTQTIIDVIIIIINRFPKAFENSILIWQEIIVKHKPCPDSRYPVDYELMRTHSIGIFWEYTIFLLPRNHSEKTHILPFLRVLKIFEVERKI